jgi:polyphosphate kinase
MSETRESLTPVDLNPEHYINRELSWLEFNHGCWRNRCLRTIRPLKK